MNHRLRLPILLLFLAMSTAGMARRSYDTYRGLVMAGYQGWFNAPGDGTSRGWRHYGGLHSFDSDHVSVDLWPDVSQYATTYATGFQFADGRTARVPSSYDASTVDLHFRWMKQYGLDGVFMQRFVAEIRNASGRHHFDHVLQSAMKAAQRYNRAIAIMYDLSGMKAAEADIVIRDIDSLSNVYNLKDRDANHSYLWEQGRPLVAVWGVGFNDGRDYTTRDAARIIDHLRRSGFSVMIGVPTHWRSLTDDTLADPGLHHLIARCEVVMPWFVGRYDADAYRATFRQHVAQDKRWCDDHGVGYAPLVYPGFSWHNLQHADPSAFFVPRNGGQFFQMQIDGALQAGCQMIYVAMFDEIDEGTAIYKLSREVPVCHGSARFTPLDSHVRPDHYLRMVGKAAKRLRKQVKTK